MRMAPGPFGLSVVCRTSLNSVSMYSLILRTVLVFLNARGIVFDIVASLVVAERHVRPHLQLTTIVYQKVASLSIPALLRSVPQQFQRSVPQQFLRSAPQQFLRSHRALLLFQFKNFLSDFTIASEKEAPEVNLWGEYLVFAQLFGIADKVQEGLAKLYPDEFADYSERLGVPRGEMSSFVHTWTALSKDASRVAQSEDAERSGGSSGGFGGRSSIGGGGGFSGGGHGGGSR